MSEAVPIDMERWLKGMEDTAKVRIAHRVIALMADLIPDMSAEEVLRAISRDIEDEKKRS